MLSWLQEDLLAADADWLIAFGHPPPLDAVHRDRQRLAIATDLSNTELHTWAVPNLQSQQVKVRVQGGGLRGRSPTFIIGEARGSQKRVTPARLLLMMS